MRLLIAPGHNPYENIALERAIMDDDEETLYLWRNEPCVVFGRNQNPYAEIDLTYAEEQDIKLCRRYSGGGAVYQDLGNLNYTWVTKEETPNRLIELVKEVLKGYGLSIEKSGRNDLLADGRKFSGMAFYREDGKTIYHGTMLVHVAQDQLIRVLKPSPLKLKSKGISSVSSRVINLSDINHTITVDSLVHRFQDVLKIPAVYAEMDEETIQRAAQLSDNRWIFGESPQYEIMLEKRLPTGNYQFQFNVINGIVEDVTVYTDDLNPNIPDTYRQALIHRIFSSDILDCLDSI